MRGIDLFSGARGWEARAHTTLGVDLLGIEHWEPAVLTSKAAGLRVLHADVAALDPLDFADEIGEGGVLVGSPPCQSRSNAGKQLGALDVQHVARCMQDLAEGRDTRAEHKAACADERSILTVEPLRWAVALLPRVVLLEQVPPVLPDWKLVGALLERFGYSWWAGILEAERYGVPQTRERAVLIARRDGVAAHPPEPTHHRFVANEPRPNEVTGLFGSLRPWVSMAEALGWSLSERPSVTVVGHSDSGGRHGIDGGSGARKTLADAQARGEWVRLRMTTMPNSAERETSEPTHYDRRQGSTRPSGQRDMVRPIPVQEPAPTIGADGLWKGRDVWTHERPATTVNADPRISKPGHHDENESGSQQKDAVRVTPEQAACLQSFPKAWPFQGSRTAVFTQVGNSVPPLLGLHLFREILPRGGVMARFWSKVRFSIDCWEWQAATNEHGHGMFRPEGQRTGPAIKAHRLAWELAHGEAPGDLKVLYKCDNPPCVNPAHLFLGTQADNVADMHAKGRGNIGSVNGRALLTEAKVIEIRERVAAGERQKVVGEELGISPASVSQIVNRKSWRHVA